MHINRYLNESAIMSSLVCYRLGHALQQWDRYPRSTERISCYYYYKAY